MPRTSPISYTRGLWDRGYRRDVAYDDATRQFAHERRQRQAYADAERSRQADMDQRYYDNLPVGMGGDVNFGRVPHPAVKVPFKPDNRTGRYDAKADDRYETPQQRAINKMAEDLGDRGRLKKLLDGALGLALEYGTPYPSYADIAEDLWALLTPPNTSGLPIPMGYKISGECATPDTRGFPGYTYGSYTHEYANQCLGGQQVQPKFVTFEEAQASGADSISYGYYRLRFMAPPGAEIFQHQIIYTKGSSSVLQALPGVEAVGLARNPNAMRLVNTTPQPLELPAPSVDVAVTPTQQTIEIVVASGGARIPPPTRTIQATRSRPPDPGTKERKSRWAQAGAALFKLMDFISESSEVVSAFYDALPEDVRARWDRPASPYDQNGQYGTDGAEWKIQAIWHNYHRIDLEKALTNVAINQVEDKLYGMAYAAKDNVTFRGRRRKRGFG